MLTYDEFCRFFYGGIGRHTSGLVSYVVIREDNNGNHGINGDEVFYAEWEHDVSESDEYGCWTEEDEAIIDENDDYHLPLAYQAYINGEEEYLP